MAPIDSKRWKQIWPRSVVRPLSKIRPSVRLSRHLIESIFLWLANRKVLINKLASSVCWLTLLFLLRLVSDIVDTSLFLLFSAFLFAHSVHNLRFAISYARQTLSCCLHFHLFTTICCVHCSQNCEKRGRSSWGANEAQLYLELINKLIIIIANIIIGKCTLFSSIYLNDKLYNLFAVTIQK